jgi:TonB family protein
MFQDVASISIMLVVASLAGCATSPRAAEPPVGPPIGTGRLPSSLACEPEPPCPACVTVTGEAARHVGSLDKEVIRAGIRAHIDDARACYDIIGLTQPSAHGRVTIKFGIGPSGAVQTSCLVSSELGAPSVDACLLQSALGWRFPAPEGGGWVIVTYPFAFERPAN